MESSITSIDHFSLQKVYLSHYNTCEVRVGVRFPTSQFCIPVFLSPTGTDFHSFQMAAQRLSGGKSSRTRHFP
jgi:hypothetical protein